MAVRLPPFPRHGRAGTVTAVDYSKFNKPDRFLDELLTTFRQFPTDNACVPHDPLGYTMYTYTYMAPGHTTSTQMSTTQQIPRAEVLQMLGRGIRITGVNITRQAGVNFWVGIDRETEINSVAITASERLNQTKATPFPIVNKTSVFSNPQLLRTMLQPVLGKCRNILFPLDLDDTDGEAHANLIIMHQTASNEYDIERWDPWQIEGSMPLLERDLARFFAIVLRPMGFHPFFVEMVYTCPEATLGLQNLVVLGEEVPECRQLLALNPDGICTLWTFVYAVLRIYKGNTDRNSWEINDHLKWWAKHDLPSLCRFASSFAATLIRAARK